ncbi:MAG: geranylgeranyl reductase family protein [Candidatus Thorarchaeota archaeon]
MLVVGGGPGGTSTAIACAQEGLKVLLIERGRPHRHKPCGGLLPEAARNVVEDIAGAEIPDDIFSVPTDLSLFYVPPSGRSNGGRVRNYRILNIDRDSFDDWLVTRAIMSGVKVKFGASFEGFTDDTNEEVLFFTQEGPQRVQADIVVGADGVRSSVRNAMGWNQSTPLLLVAQEFIDIKDRGDLEDCFYMFLRGDLSPSYAYAIPKGEELVVGTGVRQRSSPSLAESMQQFREWLHEEFGVPREKPLRKEVWALPFGYFAPGRENVILVGDAAGLCNPFSGEGIRLAVESGEAAGLAIVKCEDPKNAAAAYVEEVRGIADFVRDVLEFVLELDDDKREKFVMDELARR